MKAKFVSWFKQNQTEAFHSKHHNDNLFFHMKFSKFCKSLIKLAPHSCLYSDHQSKDQEEYEKLTGNREPEKGNSKQTIDTYSEEDGNNKVAPEPEQPQSKYVGFAYFYSLFYLFYSLFQLFLKLFTQQTFTCSNSIIHTLEKVWNTFKVYTEDTRTTLLTLFYNVYINDIEHVFVYWIEAALNRCSIEFLFENLPKSCKKLPVMVLTFTRIKDSRAKVFSLNFSKLYIFFALYISVIYIMYR